MIAHLAINWAMAHQDYLYGLATGYAVANVPLLVRFLFKLAMRIPGAHSFVVANLPALKKGIDEASAELKSDLEAEASSPVVLTPPPAPNSSEKGEMVLALALIISGAILVSGLVIAYKPRLNCQIYTANKANSKQLVIAKTISAPSDRAGAGRK